MRWTVLKAAGLFAAVTLVIGCGKKETALPTNMEQPLPKVAAPAGGGPAPKQGGGAAGGAEKKSSPTASAD